MTHESGVAPNRPHKRDNLTSTVEWIRRMRPRAMRRVIDLGLLAMNLSR